MSDVLSRTETALALAIKDRQPSSTGRMLGISHQTASRWGNDADAWTLRCWLILLCHDEPLRQAHISALSGARAISVDGSADSAAFELLRALANQMSALGQRLADLHLDRSELRQTDQELASMQTQISAMRALIQTKLRSRA